MFKTLHNLYKSAVRLNNELSRTIINDSYRNKIIDLAQKLEEIDKNENHPINDYYCERKLVKAFHRRRRNEKILLTKN